MIASPYRCMPRLPLDQQLPGPVLKQLCLHALDAQRTRPHINDLSSLSIISVTTHTSMPHTCRK